MQALTPNQLELIARQQSIRTGACGPPQATQLNSWGAGCPPGYCPPDKLPEALDRFFAGERSGCREIPWGLQALDVAASATGSFTGTAQVTICPTRIIAWTTENEGFLLTSVKFGNTEQLAGSLPTNAIAATSLQSIPLVTDCLYAGQPYTINYTNLDSTAMATQDLWLVFIGPMVG